VYNQNLAVWPRASHCTDRATQASYKETPETQPVASYYSDSFDSTLTSKSCHYLPARNRDWTETELTVSRKPAGPLSLNLTVENVLLRSPSSTESSPRSGSMIWRFLFPEGHAVAVYVFFLILQSHLIFL
jgi:hypothetical protein